MSAPTALEQWLAGECLRAETLAAVADGSLDRARTSLSSGCLCRSDGVRHVKVDGGKVHYSHPEHGDGAVTVRRLIAVAAEARTDEKAAALHAAYRAYVDEAINGRVPYPRDREVEPDQFAAAEAHFARYCVASRALEAAARAWWAPAVGVPVQGSLLDLEDVA